MAGAGAGGMTMALLLAQSGRRVTVLETTPRIGGLLQRFRRRGVPYDTGFHFTGGFDGLLRQMAQYLNIGDLVREKPFRTHVYLGENNRRISFPSTGVDDVADYLCGEFPGQENTVRDYYRAERSVVEATPMFNLAERDIFQRNRMTEYDFLTVDEFFNARNTTPELRAVLGNAAMCHGTPPDECSMSAHARVSFNLGDHIAQAEEGGDAFLRGFEREAEKLGIEVVTNCRIERFIDRNCTRALLSNGEEIVCDETFFAIHPASILEVLPETTPSLRRRVAGYRDSCGFFFVAGELTAEATPELTSFISRFDLNEILRPGGAGYGTGMVISEEKALDGRKVKTFNAFSTVFPEETAGWADSPRSGNAAYRQYKEMKTEKIMADFFRAYPEFRGKASVAANGSMLTFRDYAPPHGCGYGIRQRIGQSRLWGKLPNAENLYAIGHCSLIPGVMGTMISSFLLFRRLVGEERYFELLKRSGL